MKPSLHYICAVLCTILFASCQIMEELPESEKEFAQLYLHKEMHNFKLVDVHPSPRGQGYYLFGTIDSSRRDTSIPPDLISYIHETLPYIAWVNEQGKVVWDTVLSSFPYVWNQKQPWFLDGDRFFTIIPKFPDWNNGFTAQYYILSFDINTKQTSAQTVKRTEFYLIEGASFAQGPNGTFLLLLSCYGSDYRLLQISINGAILKQYTVPTVEAETCDYGTEAYMPQCGQPLAVKYYHKNGKDWAYFSLKEKLMCVVMTGGGFFYMDAWQHNLYSADLNSNDNIHKAGYMRSTTLDLPPILMTNVTDTSLVLSAGNVNGNNYEIYPALSFKPNHNTVAAGTANVTAQGNMLISSSYDTRHNMLLEPIKWKGQDYLMYIGTDLQGGLQAMTFNAKTGELIDQERLGGFSAPLYPSKLMQTPDGGFIVAGTAKASVNKTDVFMLKFSQNTLRRLLEH